MNEATSRLISFTADVKVFGVDAVVQFGHGDFRMGVVAEFLLFSQSVFFLAV